MHSFGLNSLYNYNYDKYREGWDRIFGKKKKKKKKRKNKDK